VKGLAAQVATRHHVVHVPVRADANRIQKDIAKSNGVGSTEASHGATEKNTGHGSRPGDRSLQGPECTWVEYVRIWSALINAREHNDNAYASKTADPPWLPFRSMVQAFPTFNEAMRRCTIGIDSCRHMTFRASNRSAQRK